MRIAAAASAEESIDGAVLPVIAGQIVIDVFVRRLFEVGPLRARDAVDRQQWNRGGAEEERTDAREETSARGPLRDPAGQRFDEFIHCELIESLTIAPPL